MAYRIDDPYNQGIGTPYLGDMNVGNVGQVPVDNMQQANWLNTISGGMMGTTPEQDAQNVALEQIQDLRINQMKGIPQGKTEVETQSIIDDLQYTNPDKLKQYQDIEKQIQDLKRQFPQNINIQQAYLDDEYDFSGIEGQTAMLNPFSIIGLIKAGLSKKQIAKVLIKNKVQKEIGKKIKPVITGVLTGGGAKAGAPGGYTGPKTYDFDEGAHRRSGGNRPDKPGGFTDPGKGSYGPHKAYGGRVSYFDGGLLSLWPR